MTYGGTPRLWPALRPRHTWYLDSSWYWDWGKPRLQLVLRRKHTQTLAGIETEAHPDSSWHWSCQQPSPRVMQVVISPVSVCVAWPGKRGLWGGILQGIYHTCDKTFSSLTSSFLSFSLFLCSFVRRGRGQDPPDPPLIASLIQGYTYGGGVYSPRDLPLLHTHHPRCYISTRHSTCAIHKCCSRWKCDPHDKSCQMKFKFPGTFLGGLGHVQDNKPLDTLLLGTPTN